MRQEATVKLHTSQIINANSRMHWRAASVKRATLVQFGILVLGRNMTPVTGRQTVTFEFTFPTRRVRDRANLHPTAKALLDGIVRAKTVLRDDSDAWIEGPDIVIREETSGLPGYVLLTVRLEDVREARRARLKELERQILAERPTIEAEKRAARERAKAARMARG